MVNGILSSASHFPADREIIVQSFSWLSGFTRASDEKSLPEKMRRWWRGPQILMKKS
jgi:hypothetical protein